MKKVINETRNQLINSPMHKPGLEFYSFFRQQQYRWSQLWHRGAFHEPELFGIGHFRTGTVSLHRILESHFRSAHEPDIYLFTKMWAAKARGDLSAEAFVDFLIQRSNTLKLQFESAGFFIYEIETLVRLFPKAKFILSIRDPIAWLGSYLSHTMHNRRRMSCWFPEWYLHHDLKPAEFHECEENSLYPVDALLDMWQRTHTRAIEHIPEERLLIVPTSGITHSLRKIETFAKLPPHSLKEEAAHHNKGVPPQKRGIHLPEQWLHERAAPYREQYRQWTGAQD